MKHGRSNTTYVRGLDMITLEEHLKRSDLAQCKRKNTKLFKIYMEFTEENNATSKHK